MGNTISFGYVFINSLSFEHSFSIVQQGKKWKLSFPLVWNSLVWLMLINFFVKIMTSTAQRHLKKQQELELANKLLEQKQSMTKSNGVTDMWLSSISFPNSSPILVEAVIIFNNGMPSNTFHILTLLKKLLDLGRDNYSCYRYTFDADRVCSKLFLQGHSCLLLGSCTQNYYSLWF